MSEFRYQAVEESGASVAGVIEADDRKSALRLLGQRGPKPLGGFRPAVDHFERGGDFRKFVVHVVAHGDEPPVKLAGLLDAQTYRFVRRSHSQMIVQAAVKASGFRHRVKKIGGSGDTHGFRPDPPTPFLTEKRSARSHWAEPT